MGNRGEGLWCNGGESVLYRGWRENRGLSFSLHSSNIAYLRVHPSRTPIACHTRGSARESRSVARGPATLLSLRVHISLVAQALSSLSLPSPPVAAFTEPAAFIHTRTQDSSLSLYFKMNRESWGCVNLGCPTGLSSSPPFFPIFYVRDLESVPSVANTQRRGLISPRYVPGSSSRTSAQTCHAPIPTASDALGRRMSVSGLQY